jgi:hypothetical protein
MQIFDESEFYVEASAGNSLSRTTARPNVGKEGPNWNETLLLWPSQNTFSDPTNPYIDPAAAKGEKRNSQGIQELKFRVVDKGRARDDVVATGALSLPEGWQEAVGSVEAQVELKRPKLLGRQFHLRNRREKKASVSLVRSQPTWSAIYIRLSAIYIIFELYYMHLYVSHRLN